MDEIKELLQIDWWYVVLAIVLVLVCVKYVWSLLDWLIFDKFGVETRKMKEARQTRESLETAAAGLKALEQKHNNDEVALENHLTSLEDCVATFIETTQNAIKTQDDSNREHWETSKQIREEFATSIKAIVEDNKKKDEQIQSLIVANKEMLAEKINEKYKHYLAIEGIPQDEYDEFVSMHKAYNGVGGNHNGDAKFEYCMEHLPIIPVETKLVFKHKE